MSYPENYKNDALKIVEQKLIYNLCFCNDDKEFKQLLNQINSIREKRKVIIGEKYFDYEKDVESLEGPAFYCQLLYYQKYADVSDNLKKNSLEF
jgi:GMP synthase PP-ATPase subunit